MATVPGGSVGSAGSGGAISGPTGGGFDRNLSFAFKTLMNEMKAKQFDTIRFAAYRTAIKLRYIQHRTFFHLLDISNVIEAFRLSGLSALTLEDGGTLARAKLEEILGLLYEQLNRRLPAGQQITVDTISDILLAWLFYSYDKGNHGCLDVFTLKVALSTIVAAKPLEKFKYHFSLLSNPSGALVPSKFERYLHDLLMMAVGVFEGSNFSYDQYASRFMLSGRSKSVLLEDFIDRMMTEPGPQCLLWLTIYHRLAYVENVKHAVRCEGCRKESIIGFRYKCQRCPNYSLCQDCFWTGVTSGHHTNQHDVKEYTTFSNNRLSQSLRKTLSTGRPPSAGVYAGPVNRTKTASGSGNSGPVTNNTNNTNNVPTPSIGVHTNNMTVASTNPTAASGEVVPPPVHLRDDSNFKEQQQQHLTEQTARRQLFAATPAASGSSSHHAPVPSHVTSHVSGSSSKQYSTEAPPETYPHSQQRQPTLHTTTMRAASSPNNNNNNNNNVGTARTGLYANSNVQQRPVYPSPLPVGVTSGHTGGVGGGGPESSLPLYSTGKGDEEEHRLIAQYVEVLSRHARDGTNLLQQDLLLLREKGDLANPKVQKDLIDELEMKNLEILKKIQQLKLEQQQTVMSLEMRSSGTQDYTQSHLTGNSTLRTTTGVVTSPQPQQQPPLTAHTPENPHLLGELRALRQRKDELESRMGNLQESRKELMAQLESLMQSLKGSNTTGSGAGVSNSRHDVSSFMMLPGDVAYPSSASPAALMGASTHVIAGRAASLPSGDVGGGSDGGGYFGGIMSPPLYPRGGSAMAATTNGARGDSYGSLSRTNPYSSMVRGATIATTTGAYYGPDYTASAPSTDAGRAAAWSSYRMRQQPASMLPMETEWYDNAYERSMETEGQQHPVAVYGERDYRDDETRQQGSVTGTQPGSITQRILQSEQQFMNQLRARRPQPGPNDAPVDIPYRQSAESPSRSNSRYRRAPPLDMSRRSASLDGTAPDGVEPPMPAASTAMMGGSGSYKRDALLGFPRRRVYQSEETTNTWEDQSKAGLWT